MHVPVGDRVYSVISFLDEYSRYIVHQEVLLGLDSLSTSLAAQKAIETLPKGADGKPLTTLEIRSDNGSGYISKEFRMGLKEDGLTHRRIQPHCPEENGLTERVNRTIREDLEEENLLELSGVTARACEAEQALQPGASSQRLGLLAAVGILPWRSVASVRGAAG
jgi:transposase InsO family protein